jgi:asparaginyl-tRNA synthetase
LASFKHIEWELGWADLDDLMDLSEQLTQACFNYVLSSHMDDLLVLDGSVSKGIIERLRLFVSDSYARLSYNDAIDLLVAAFKAGKLETLVKWGDDLGSVYESYLAEMVFGKPIFVYNYPKKLKSFYMKQNDDGTTVQGCDLLMPGLGELIGSSVRESNYDKLMAEVVERKMNTEGIEWYLDLRRNGSKPSAGAGLGFERLVMCCTGLKNIRLCGVQPVYYKGKLVF